MNIRISSPRGGWVGLERGFGNTQHGPDSIERGAGISFVLGLGVRAGDRFLALSIELVKFFRGVSCMG